MCVEGKLGLDGSNSVAQHLRHMAAMDRNRLEMCAPGKWRELREAIKRECALIGRTLELHIYDQGPGELTVERVKDGWVSKQLRLEYDSLALLVKWSCCDPSYQTGTIGFRASDGSVLFEVNGKNTPLPEIVAVLTSCITGD
jgi:hypothetical protein